MMQWNKPSTPGNRAAKGLIFPLLISLSAGMSIQEAAFAQAISQPIPLNRDTAVLAALYPSMWDGMYHSLCSTGNILAVPFLLISGLLLGGGLLMGAIALWRGYLQQSSVHWQQIQADLQQANAKLQQEICDRQQIESALRDCETRLSLALTAIDHLPIAVFVKDGRADHFGEMLLWNHTSEQMFGVTAEQAIGKTVYDYFPKEQADFFEQKDREAFEQGTPADIPEEPIDSYSLGRRILHTVKVPVYNDQQQPEYLLCFSEDITDRKQAEAALRESEVRWQFALEGAGAGVWDWNTQTDTVFYSRQWKAMLGYDDYEVGNRLEEWDSRVHPDDKAQCHANLQQYFRGETSVYQNEHRMRCKDGSYKWILDCGKVVEWTTEGQPIRMIGSHTDISERKRVEEELRQAVATNQALLSAIPDLILRISRDGIYREGIPSKEVPLLAAAEQLIGKSLWEMLPADLAQQRIDAIERAFQTELTQIHEYPISINGEWRYEEARCVVCGEDEAMVLVRDITDRKRAEAAVQESEERLRMALAATNQGIYDLNIQTGEAIVSPEYAIMLGYEPETFQETNAAWIERLHPEDRESVARIYQAYVAGEIPEYKVEFRQRTQNGGWKWILSLGKIVEWDRLGQPRRMLGTHTNIDDRKQSEALLQIYAQQQAVVAQLGQLALAATDLSIVMERATALVAESLGVEYCKVLELLPNGTGLVLRAGVGWQPGLVGQAIVGMGTDSQAGYTLSVDEPVIVEDLQNESRFKGSSLLRDHQVVSGLSVIIHGNDRPFGTLGAYSTQRRHFTQNDVNFLQAVANILATAIERKRAEGELQASEQRYRAIVEDQIELLLRWTPDRTIRFANSAYCRFHGLVREEFIGQDLLTNIHESIRDWLRVSLENLTRSLTPENPTAFLEHWVVDATGQLYYYHFSDLGIFDEDGRLIEIQTVGYDITDRKQAELEIRHLNEALEQQNQNLEALVEQRTAELLTFINALPDYIYVIEREEMRVPFCNDRFASTTLLGDRHLVQEKTIFECFPADNAAYFAEQNSQVFESGETLHIQESFMLPSGQMHVDTYKIPLKRPNGEVYALIGTSRDITELILARQALMQRSAQLEASNQELESFSYSVSHDLRAPLRHINGFVNALRQKLDGHHALTDAKVAHYLQVIETSSQKMALLIDGLLTLSRIGRKPMDSKPVSLRELVDEAIVLVQSGSETASSVEFVVGELSTVQGDAALLQQVLSNLINNAVKFSRNHPTPRIEIGRLPEGTIFIKDNGVGFQMEYADKLFGAFQRLHSQTAFEGTGIGLAIVQRIIHRHGGTIWAESQSNQGATFYFTLGTPS